MPQTVTQKTVRADEVDERTAKAYSIVYQIMYLVLGLIQGALVLRFIFRLLGANPATEFVAFIYDVTAALMAPFRSILPSFSTQGAIFEWSILVAMIIYALLGWVLAKIISIFYTADA